MITNFCVHVMILLNVFNYNWEKHIEKRKEIGGNQKWPTYIELHAEISIFLYRSTHRKIVCTFMDIINVRLRSTLILPHVCWCGDYYLRIHRQHF